MISLTDFCSLHAARILSLRTGPMPFTSRRRLGLFSMISNTPAPKAATSLDAKCGPMPLMSPDPRYLSIPSAVFGLDVRASEALNCCPCLGSMTHSPSASIHSPSVTLGRTAIIVIWSRLPPDLTLSTEKPVSSLWKVTFSTRPDTRPSAFSFDFPFPDFMRES